MAQVQLCSITLMYHREGGWLCLDSSETLPGQELLFGILEPPGLSAGTGSYNKELESEV